VEPEQREEEGGLETLRLAGLVSAHRCLSFDPHL
jgi:hypothetical protein